MREHVNVRVCMCVGSRPIPQTRVEQLQRGRAQPPHGNRECSNAPRALLEMAASDQQSDHCSGGETQLALPQETWRQAADGDQRSGCGERRATLNAHDQEPGT